MKITWGKLFFVLGMIVLLIGVETTTVDALEEVSVKAEIETGSVTLNYPADLFLDEEASVVCYNENWNKNPEDLMSNIEHAVYLDQKTLSSEGGTFTFMINEDANTNGFYYLVLGVESKEEAIVVEFKFNLDEVCKTFSDVKHGAWYETGIQCVYDNGLMNGSNGKFNPTADITRAQLVTTLYRLAGSPEVTDGKALTDFSDVVEGKYYTDAVCWAYAEGIATGNDGKFNPNGQLIRQQMAAFFFRYAEYAGLDVEIREDVSSMVGADKVSGYAKTAVEWAVRAGLISGSEITDANGNKIKDLNPRGNTTRAQVALVLQRFCE